MTAYSLFLDQSSVASATEVVGPMPIYKASTNGAARDISIRLRDHYNLADYIESDEDEANAFEALGRIFTDATRANVQVDLNDYNWTLSADYTLPASKRAIFHGHGSLDCDGGSIIRSAHDQFTVFEGFKVTGGHPAFAFSASPSGSAYCEFEINRMTFAMDSGVWAITTSGAREGTIDKSVFRSGKGIYRTLSNILSVSKCHFLGLDFGIFSDGQKSGYSCAINLDKTEILGCKRGLLIYGDDDGSITNCTIDYNDDSLRLLGQDRFKIFGGYIGNRKAENALSAVTSADAATLAAAISVNDINPGVFIGAGNGDNSQKIVIVGMTGTGHVTDDNYDNIYIESASEVTIADCPLSFYTRNAVRYGASVTYLNVHDNTLSHRSGSSATKAIECTSTDDSSNRIHHNKINSGQSITAPFANIQSNTGYLTANRGEVVVPSGNSTYTVAHGLPFTPNKYDVILTPTNAAAATLNPYVSGVDATNITIGFTSATTVNSGVGWSVTKRAISG